MAGLIQNEDIKSLAELTGAGGTASQLPNDTKIYVTANSINKQLSQAIIDGDIGGGGALTTNSPQTLTNGGVVSFAAPTKPRQCVFLGGTGGQTVLSTTPFGVGTFADGYEIEIVGTDNSNPVEIPYNDAAKGCVGNFSSIILGRFERASFIYSLNLNRFIGAKL